MNTVCLITVSDQLSKNRALIMVKLKNSKRWQDSKQSYLRGEAEAFTTVLPSFLRNSM